MAQPFDHRLSEHPPVTLSLWGEMDADAIDSLRCLVERRGEIVLVDARGVDFVSAAGINFLLALAPEGGLEILANPKLERLVRLCRVDDILFCLTEQPET